MAPSRSSIASIKMVGCERTAAAAFVTIASAATTAPLNPAYRHDEFVFYLNDLGAKALVVEPGSDSPAAKAAGSLEIANWWVEGRDLELAISGSDLVAAGCPPGPGLGRGLAAARAAALDGKAANREEQLRVALAAAEGP